MLSREFLPLCFLFCAIAGSGDRIAAAADGSAALTRDPSFTAARQDYFRAIEGDRDATERAASEFSALRKATPRDAVIRAYAGSLELLEAARTWEIWNKHKLAQQGLAELDDAVGTDPANLEARFVRAATTWNLPFFFHRKEQAKEDFCAIGPHAEDAARHGALPKPLAAASLNYYGQVLRERGDQEGAKRAFRASVRVDGDSPGGRDAAKRLRDTG